MKRIPLALAFAAALFAAAALAAPLEPLEVITERGSCAYRVELADTPEERRVGLMHRTSMPEDQGMLFDFGEDRLVKMWMKNTYISLDMLFVDRDGLVRHVAENTEPLSLDVIDSRAPVRAVLELNAGQAADCGVRPGDRLVHPMFED